jgi:hypothetical protein
MRQASVQTTPSQNPPLPPQARNNVSNQGSTWDGFEHFLMFATLYIFSTSLALVLYSLIDHWVPGLDQNLRQFTSGLSKAKIESLRWYLALMIVSFPFFAFFLLNVTKRTLIKPEMRSIDVRKFFIYITLFITFIIMFYNVLYTVYSFLNGNIYLNFILHLLTTLSISGLIFAHFAFQVMEDRKING